jgi:phosphatidylserine decarboxylase
LSEAQSPNDGQPRPGQRSLARVLRWVFYLVVSYGWLGCMFWLFLRQVTAPLIVGALGSVLLYGLARWLDGQAFRRPRRPLLTHFVGVMLFIALQLVAWRYLYFFADPERTIPRDAALVSPADGWVVYVRRVEGGKAPVAIKEGRSIALSELLGRSPERIRGGILIGIFMTPMSVHVNRAPIAGRIARRHYVRGRSMTSMLPMSLRLMFGQKPYERGSEHIVRNERETLLFEGAFPVYMTRIADPYVDKIELWKAVGAKVKKGERIGLIRMGSQTDLYVPAKVGDKRVEVLVREGQYVFGGRTAILRLAK